MQRPIISVMLFWTLIIFIRLFSVLFVPYPVTKSIAQAFFYSNFYRKNFSAHAHRAADAGRPMSAARRSLVTLPTLCRGLCAACGAFCRCNLAAPSVYTHDAFSLASSRLERCIATIHPLPLLLSLLKTLHAL